jgi:cytochrome P450
VAFGFGPHLCLGAHHARLVVRSLLKVLCERVDRIELITAQAKYEQESSYRRRLAYESLRVKLRARAPADTPPGTSGC